ncbi:hypothetical protein Tco_0053670 [Tanacetum coccineum]
MKDTITTSVVTIYCSQSDIIEAGMPLRKRARFNAPTARFEIGESSAVATARQPKLEVTHAADYSFVDIVDATPGRPMYREVGYRITDVWDDMVGDMRGIAPTTLEDLSQRVIDLATTLAQDTHEIDRQYHLHTAMLLESEARHARQAQLQTMDYNRAIHAELLAYRAEHEHDKTREPEPARDLEPWDRPTDAGSSSQGVATALAEYEATRGSGKAMIVMIPELAEEGRHLLLGNALMWWNSYTKTVSHEVAYGMTWKTLKKMMTDKYCLRGEIKKLEIKL